MNYETIYKLLKSKIPEDNNIGVEILTKLKSKELDAFFKEFGETPGFDSDMVLHGVGLGSEEPQIRERTYIKKQNYYLYISENIITWESHKQMEKFIESYALDISINIEENY